MRQRRRILFACAAVVMSVLGSVVAVLAVDLYVHHKFMESAGLNVWGYRGPTVGRKDPGERRLIVLGGSTAFGYGVHSDEAFPVVLERLLRQRPASGNGPSVVNLAYNNEGAYSFKFTLKDYEYLDYDAVVFYTDYNDLGGNVNPSNYRHSSTIFRLTGYFPMLPLVMAEKAKAIRYGGRLEAAYRGEKTAFRPNLAERTIATALETAADISAALERQLARMAPAPGAAEAEGGPTECGNWPWYCRDVYGAVKLVLDQGKRALIVTQPYISEPHKDQQSRMVGYLHQTLDEKHLLRFANLGPTLDLKAPSLAYDGMHLTVAGNRQIAESLVGPVRDLLK